MDRFRDNAHPPVCGGPCAFHEPAFVATCPRHDDFANNITQYHRWLYNGASNSSASRSVAGRGGARGACGVGCLLWCVEPTRRTVHRPWKGCPGVCVCVCVCVCERERERERESVCMRAYACIRIRTLSSSSVCTQNFGSHNQPYSLTLSLSLLPIQPPLPPSLAAQGGVDVAKDACGVGMGFSQVLLCVRRFARVASHGCPCVASHACPCAMYSMYLRLAYVMLYVVLICHALYVVVTCRASMSCLHVVPTCRAHVPGGARCALP
jgi:hypothetical protein